jgi:membrane-associated protease RseP (regulator of RpoE activity)
LTCFTTLLAGAMQRGISPVSVFFDPFLLLHGLPYSATLLLILGAHELGHYFATRRWGVDASLPYFIPAPTLFGTFGAVIRIRGPILDRRALLDVAVAGPLAGMAVALPATLIGLWMSNVVMTGSGGLGLGESLLFKAVTWSVLGVRGPGEVILLHPIAFAGWCGFLVTSLNLIPAGQLDGGHIVYALFDRWHRTLSSVVGVLLIGMAYWWPGWLLWAAIALFLGRRHPPIYNGGEKMGRGRRFLGYSCIILMLLTFTWVPLHIH